MSAEAMRASLRLPSRKLCLHLALTEGVEFVCLVEPNVEDLHADLVKASANLQRDRQNET